MYILFMEPLSTKHQLLIDLILLSLAINLQLITSLFMGLIDINIQFTYIKFVELNTTYHV